MTPNKQLALPKPKECTLFLERFVVPLVAGGGIHIGKPIDEPTLEQFVRDLPHASVPVVAIDEAREQILSKLVVSVPNFMFDETDLYLAAAVHNLLYLCHPDADDWGVTQSARARVVASAQAFAARHQSRSRAAVMARHALLHNIFDISRTDIKVSWWTGSATYYGQSVPTRLLRWSSVRRVHQAENVVGFHHLFQGADVAAVVGTLLRRSPLSMLLLHSKSAPHLHWEDVVFLLRDPPLARVIAYEAVRGATAKEIVEVPARFAASFDQMLERSPKEADVRTVCAFLVYLNCLLAMKELNLGAQSPLLSALLSAAQRPKGLSTFLALPSALEQVDARISVPPGVEEMSKLSARWHVHRKQSVDALGQGVIDGLAGRLRKHLRTAPASGPETTSQ